MNKTQEDYTDPIFIVAPARSSFGEESTGIGSAEKIELRRKISEDAPSPIIADPEPGLAPKSPVKRALVALSMIFIATLSGVADSQLTKQAYSVDFRAPFFMVYCNNIVRSFIFPAFLVAAWAGSKVKKREFSFRNKTREGLLIYGPKGPTILAVLKVSVALGIINMVSLGMYMTTLSYVSASEATTLMTSQVAMIYIISVIFLGQALLVFKIVATIACFGGVALTAYAKGFEADSITGITIALVTSLMYAIGQTYMKAVMRRSKLGQVCLYMTSTAIFVIVFGWIAPLVTKVIGNEIWDITNIPWGLIFGASVAALTTAFVVNYGISVSSPFFMSMYNLVRIPINNLIDAYARGEVFTYLEIGGALLIALGFFMVVIPDEKVSFSIKKKGKRNFNLSADQKAT